MITHIDLRVLICGNYGTPTKKIDGQSIKTRTLRDALDARLGKPAVDVLDTASVFQNPLSFYLTARQQFATCTHIVMLPGSTALGPDPPHWDTRNIADVTSRHDGLCDGPP